MNLFTHNKTVLSHCFDFQSDLSAIINTLRSKMHKELAEKHTRLRYRDSLHLIELL